MKSLKDVIIDLDVRDIKTFTRKSGNTGQEVVVDSGSKYNANVSAPDKEEVDLSNCKGVTSFLVSICFQSFQCVSDNDKKYYKRVPTIFIKDIASVTTNDIEIN